MPKKTDENTVRFNRRSEGLMKKGDYLHRMLDSRVMIIIEHGGKIIAYTSNTDLTWPVALSDLQSTNQFATLRSPSDFRTEREAEVERGSGQSDAIGLEASSTPAKRPAQEGTLDEAIMSSIEIGQAAAINGPGPSSNAMMPAEAFDQRMRPTRASSIDSRRFTPYQSRTRASSRLRGYVKAENCE
ncbi:MAG: hypothetical protein M1814_000919 [Vezdaea aestivalis]|nr:MAG: hypothetical protein M1814_000919 [Vezdaea aestivalis]